MLVLKEIFEILINFIHVYIFLFIDFFYENSLVVIKVFFPHPVERELHTMPKNNKID